MNQKINSKSVRYKPGFEGVDIDIRLKAHRSSIPGCKLEFLIYTEDASLVETSVLKRFKSKKWSANHEWLINIDVNTVIKSTRTILDVLGIEYTEEKEVEGYNNQIITE